MVFPIKHFTISLKKVARWKFRLLNTYHNCGYSYFSLMCLHKLFAQLLFCENFFSEKITWWYKVIITENKDLTIHYSCHKVQKYVITVQCATLLAIQFVISIEFRRVSFLWVYHKWKGSRFLGIFPWILTEDTKEGWWHYKSNT